VSDNDMSSHTYYLPTAHTDNSSSSFIFCFSNLVPIFPTSPARLVALSTSIALHFNLKIKSFPNIVFCRWQVAKTVVSGTGPITKKPYFCIVGVDNNCLSTADMFVFVTSIVNLIFTIRRRRRGCFGAGYVPLPASQLSNTTIHHKLNNIYSQNLTVTSCSFYLCSKVKYNILILPLLVVSFFKYLSVISCYHPTGQAIPLVNNPVSKVKLTHIIFKARLLES